MSSTYEPAIWSCDTGQQMPCFDSCQLTMKWNSNMTDKQGERASQISHLVNRQATGAMLSNSVRSHHAPASKCH